MGTEGTWDVVIVGGGPAGSAAATLLAGRGRRVLIVEREAFPRHHVGESTLLSIHSVLRWLGVAERVEEAGFRHKTGATYLWGRDRVPWSFHFSELSGPDDGWRRPYSYELERDVFDQILLERAAECGAARIRASAEELVSEDGRVTGIRLRRPGGSLEEVAARWVLDASGQACLGGKAFGWRRRHPRLRGAALYGYWRGGPPRYELLGGDLTTGDRSNILVVSTAWGWVWLIPQRGDRVSVGAVVAAGGERPGSRGLADRYHRLLGDCEEVRPLLADLEPDAAQPVRAVADWSYRCERFTSNGLFLAGDAACFVDPILSSGLHLAMRAGISAACAIGTLLEGGDEPLVHRWYESTYRTAYHQYEAMALWWYHGDSRQRAWFAAAQGLTGGGDPAAAEGGDGGSLASAEAQRRAFVELASGQPRGGYVTVPLRDGDLEVTMVSLFHPYAAYLNKVPMLRSRLGAPGPGPGAAEGAPPADPGAASRCNAGGAGLAPGVELRLQPDPQRVRLELVAAPAVPRQRERDVDLTGLWPVLTRLDGRRSVEEVGDEIGLEDADRTALRRLALHLQERHILTNVR
jgi:FAD-dependent halogenase